MAKNDYFWKGDKLFIFFQKVWKWPKIDQNQWAIAHAFCSEMAKNEHFWKGDKFFIVFQKVWKWPKIDQNHGL